MIFHENRLQTILMKYHTFFFFSKIRKDVENVSSAAVVIGALRVNITMTLLIYRRTAVHFLSFPWFGMWYVRYNFLIWVKTVEIPIWCARINHPAQLQGLVKILNLLPKASKDIML